MAAISLKAPESVRRHLYRFFIIGLLSLVMVHLLSYGRLPFSEGYRFPFLGFLIIFGFGAVICTTNYFIARRISFGSRTKGGTMLRESVIHILITTFLYTFLYIAVFLLIFGYPFNIIHYLKYLFISNAIMLFEYVLVKALTDKHSEETPVSRHILLKTGQKNINLHMEEISMVCSSDGIISFFLTDGRHYVSQFGSLEELQFLLPEMDFFRLNRQIIVHRNSVRSYRKDKNRKLSVALSNPKGYESLMVSRYRSREFRDWLERIPSRS